MAKQRMKQKHKTNNNQTQEIYNNKGQTRQIKKHTKTTTITIKQNNTQQTKTQTINNNQNKLE